MEAGKEISEFLFLKMNDNYKFCFFFFFGLEGELFLDTALMKISNKNKTKLKKKKDEKQTNSGLSCGGGTLVKTQFSIRNILLEVRDAFFLYNEQQEQIIRNLFCLFIY